MSEELRFMNAKELTQIYEALTGMKDSLERIANDESNPAQIVALCMIFLTSLVLDNRGILDEMRGVNND